MDYKILFKYLDTKIDNFKHTQGNKIFFTCPNINSHLVKEEKPTASFINGTDKMYCFVCGLKATFIDIVKLLEPEKKDWTDSKIISSIDGEANLNLYPELDMYMKNGWSIMRCPQNDKKPYPGIAFSEETHYDKAEWISWIDQKNNIAVRAGEVSKITVIDIDIYKKVEGEKEQIRLGLIMELDALDTLKQMSPHGGVHYFVEFDSEFKNKAGYGDIYLDIRNTNGYLLVQPSSLDTISYKFEDLKKKIQKLTPELKAKILALSTKKSEIITNTVVEPTLVQKTLEATPELQHNNLDGCCNDTFVQFAGVLKKLNVGHDIQKSILYYLNKNWLAKPQEPKAIDAMLGSIEGYKENEEQTAKSIVYEYLKEQKEITTAELLETKFNGERKKRELITKYLAEFVKEGKAVRIRPGHFMYKEKVVWEEGKEFVKEWINFKVPYFYNISNFLPGSIIIIGAPTGHGKTTLSMNMVKQFKEQGIKPYYLNLESTSGFQITAEQLGISMNDLYVPKEEVINPLHMELEKNVVTIIDFLDLSEDFTDTGTIMKYFREEMTRKSGILIILTQTRPSNNDWFAKDLICHVARLAARFVLDDDSGKYGHFEIDKMTFPIGNIRKATLHTQFDPNTKLLTLKQ